MLHLVADMQEEHTKSAKSLLDHLVKAGKRAGALEKHVDKELRANVAAEKKRIAEEGPEDEGDEMNELANMLKGFFDTFNDHLKEFGNKEVRKHFVAGNAVYDQLVTLHSKITGDTPPLESEVAEMLDKIDLKSV